MALLKSASIACLVAIAALVAKTRLAPLPRPSFSSEGPYKALHNIWSPDEMDGLLRRVEEIAVFPTTSKDQTSPVDHIGEAVPPDSDGKCPHPLMVASQDKSRCTLAHRVDVAMHYLKSGGRASFKNDRSRLIARMLSFPKFLHADMLTMLGGEFKTLFGSPAYLKAKDEICPGRPVLDPFQLGIIVQVPGQQVPTHFDAPWFWGASRFSLPQWLLVVMEQSKLWEQQRVHQIQGVAYIHNFADESKYAPGEIDKTFGGGFFFYPAGPGGRSEVFEARRNSAITLDGSIMVHGTEPFTISGAPPLPLLNKDADTSLRFKGNETWDLVADGQVLATYKTQHLRISLVWRARCFASEEEQAQFHEQLKGEQLTVAEVLDKLVADLRKRGRLGPSEPVPEPVDLAQLLLEEYIRYPYGVGKFPFNYCIVQHFVPGFLAPLFAPFCSDL